MPAILTKKQQYWLDFLIAMTEREVKARYKHAVLGFLWIILNPLLQMLTIGLIFQFFVPIKTDNYFLFLFVGLLPWNFFAYTFSKTTTSILHERNLIQKANFPREALVLSIVFSNAFHFGVSLLLLCVFLVLVLILNGQVSFDVFAIFIKITELFLVCIWLLFFVSGISLLTAALNTKYRDINFMVQAVIPLWFYATPIVYSLQLLPHRLALISYLNPLVGCIEIYRWVFLSQKVFWWSGVGVSFGISLLVGMFGIWYFGKESHSFDDWL